MCSDCNEENTNCSTDETGGCCSCSCSDTGSETNCSGDTRPLPSVEERKKDLLSNLSILQTNREPTSVQHVLQFVEALTHSEQFLRRYNLQEDFCLDCLISEPNSICCTNGLAQLNINESSRDYCAECDGSTQSPDERCSSQNCSECTSSPKSSLSRRQRTIDRRKRRRRRNGRYNFPRTQSNMRNSASSPRQLREPASSGRDCSECQNSGRNSAEYRQSPANSLFSNCEECACEAAGCQNDRFRSGTSSEICNSKTLDDSDFCEECANEELRAERGCSIPGRNDWVNKNLKHRNDSRRNPQLRRNAPEAFCTCCHPPNSYPLRGPGKSNAKKKWQKTSKKPDCEQQEESASCRNNRQNKSSDCRCDDCQTNSDCSDESCD